MVEEAASFAMNPQVYGDQEQPCNDEDVEEDMNMNAVRDEIANGCLSIGQVGVIYVCINCQMGTFESQRNKCPFDMHCHDVTNCMRINEFVVPFVIMYATNNG